jgi:hypothetical protein
MAKTQPLSIRLSETAARLVGEEMRRSGRSRSSVVEELAEEAAKSRLFPGIGFRGRPRPAWVIGTGLDVWELVELVHAYEGVPHELYDAHPLVSERAVALARAYADRFPAEVEPFLVAQHRSLDQIAELYPFIERSTTPD